MYHGSGSYVYVRIVNDHYQSIGIVWLSVIMGRSTCRA